jgi:hypothetical protein
MSKNKNRFAELEPVDGRPSRLTGEPAVVEEAPPPAPGRAKVALSGPAVEDDERSVEDALSGSLDVSTKAADPSHFLRHVIGRVEAAKSSARTWNSLSQVQRLTLLGAYHCAKEALGEIDESGVPCSLSRFLGPNTAI